jgi:hypothetical protein
MTLRFNPYSNYFDVLQEDVLVARWSNADDVPTADRLILRGGGAVSWFVDDVTIKTIKPTVGDTFRDLDYTNDPAWVVDSGVFAADGSSIGNVSPRAGWLNFGTAGGTQIHLDLDNVVDNTPITVKFLLMQPNGAAGSGYIFKMGLMDTDSGEVYYENATLSTGFYGTSGFHGYNSSGELVAGTAGEALDNGVMWMEMRFDPETGVEIYKNNVLVASWTNFKNLTKVDRLILNNGNGAVSWFVDGVEVYAVNYEPQFCGDMYTYYFDGDISGPSSIPDCQVNMIDLAVMANEFLACTEPYGVGCQDVLPDTQRVIPAGTATVDADLSDWANADWIDLDQQYFGFGMDVTGAKFAARWDAASDRIYMAVVVPDTDRNFEDDPCSWNTSDRIEVYSQGSGLGGGNYNADQDFAQQYVLGVTDADNNALWAELGNGTALGSVDLLYAGTVDTVNNEIIYELGIKQYDNYDAAGAGTVVSDLAAGDTVRLDIVAGTLFYSMFLSDYDYGMWSENMLGGKFENADAIAEYTLMEVDCGLWGYMSADITGAGGAPDCVVDLNDFAALASAWMQCSDPADSACDAFWK